MALKGFGKKNKNSGIDLVDSSVQAATLVLGVVQQAAQYAPMPYLQQAAKTTLIIIQTLQAMKDNKADFQRLGATCTSLIAAIWESYERSPNKEHWPPRELGMVVTDLVVTLDDIRDFLLDQAKRSKTVRFIHTMTDRGKIVEYRYRLDDAIAKFEVSSHLNMNDAIYQLLRENKEMKEMLEQQKTEAMKILEKVEQEDERARQEQRLKNEKEKAMEKEQEELRRREETRRRDEERKMQIVIQERQRKEEEEKNQKALEELKRKQAADEKRMKEGRLKVEGEMARTSEFTEEDETDSHNVFAELEEYQAKEKEYLEKQVRAAEMRLKKSKKAQVESEDEDEAALDEVSEAEDESGSEEELQPRKAKARVQKTGKKKVKTPSQQPTHPQPSSQADLNAQFAGMAVGHSPSPGPVYQMSTPFVNPYPYYSPHSYGSPQVSPGITMGYQLAPSPYSPPPQVQNFNSGNVTHTSISNIGNDFSTNYAPPARRTRRKPKVQ